MKKDNYMKISLSAFSLSLILLIFYKTIYYVDLKSDFSEFSSDELDSFNYMSQLIYTLFQSSSLLFFIAGILALFFYFSNKKTSRNL